MNFHGNKFLKTWCLPIVSVFCTVGSVLAQESDSLNKYKFSSLAFGTDFTSNNNINGRVSEFNSQPVLSGQISYYHKWGIDAAIVVSNIWNSDETNSRSSQETSLSIAYDYDFTNWLNTSVSYNHYFYSKNSYSIQSDYEDLLSLNLFSEVDWWITNAMLGYYSGKRDELFINFETGIDFTFDNVLKKGNVLFIQPVISVYAGDVNFYNTDAYRDYYFLYGYSLRYPNATVNEMIEQLKNPTTYFEQRLSNNIQERPWLLNKVSNLPSALVVASIFKEQHSFGISSMGFALPVYYGWGNFMLNVGLSAYKPINQPSYIDDSWSVYTNVGVTYFISW